MRVTAFVLADLLAGSSSWGIVPPIKLAAKPVAASTRLLPLVAPVQPTPQAAASAAASGCPTNCTTFFGPQRYDRTSGTSNVYTTTVTVPTSVTSAFWLRVQNGEAAGSHRVSSATLWVNGAKVAGPTDFGLGVSGFDRAVTLTTQTILKVQLQSAAGSYLYVRFCGQPVDRSAPQIGVTQPTPGSVITATRPHLRTHYTDPVGNGDLWASGVNTSTLKVTLDGTDRTRLFTKGATDADADVSSSLALADGVHTLAATVKDNSGNSGTTTASFSVVTKAPTLSVVSPVEGALVGSTPVTVSGTVSSSDPNLTVVCKVGTTTTTASRNGSSFTCSVALVEGADAITVTASDSCSHSTAVTRNVTLDSLAPSVTIGSPAAGSLTGATQTAVSGTVTDAGSTATAVSVSVNGVAATVQRSGATAFSFTAALSLGSADVTFTASATDAAGHVGISPPTLVRIDRTPPQIALAQPVPGSTLGVTTPHLRLHYGDATGNGESAASGPNAASLLVAVDGTDRTALFTKGATDADADIPSNLALSDGSHTVVASIQDVVGNPGTTTSSFVVDSRAPDLSVTSPAEGALLGTTAVTVTGSAADSDPNVTVTCQVGSAAPATASRNGSAFSCGLALTEGADTITVTATDSFSHQATAIRHVTLDTIAPVVDIGTPVSNTFTNGTQETVTGTAVDAGSSTTVPSILVNGVAAAVQRTGARTFSYTATVPLGAGGDLSLQASATDAAGHVGTSAPVILHVDRTPPQIVLAQPSPGSTVGTGTPHLRLHYQDLTGSGETTASGINSPTLVVTVDGTDRTGLFTKGATDADADVPAALTLADGSHTVTAQIQDGALNTGTTTSTFTTLTQAPAVAIASPGAGAVLRASPATVTGSVSSADPSVTVQCQAATTVAAGLSGGSFTCAVGLAEGTSAIVVTATDSHGRSGSASRNVTLDSLAPVVDIQSPVTGTYTNAGQVTVSGTVTDAGSSTTTPSVSVNGAPASVQRTGVTTFSYSANAPAPATGDAMFQATATDAAGNVGVSAPVVVHVDRTPPVVRITDPSAGAILKSPVRVTGTVSDAASGLVTVNGNAATVTSGAFAADVPAGDGPLTLSAQAWDAAGNTATDSVDVVADSTPPAILVAAPADGTLTNGASIHVAGSVSDAHASTLTANGQTVPLAGDAFDVDVPLPAEGPLSIALVATDGAGNTGTRNLSLTVDRTPPQLQVVSPAPEAPIASSPVMVQGTVSDASGVTVTVDGTAATVTGQAWQVAIPLSAGDHTFSVAALDGAGNTTSASRHVFVDLSAPVVTITGPAPGSLTRQPSIDVTGTVSGASPGVNVTVGGVPTTVTPTGGGSFAFTAASVALAEGDNTLQAVATTAAGHSGSASVLVTRDTTPPVVALAVPDTLAKGQTATIAATATDVNAVNTVVLKVGGSAVGAFTAPPYTAQLTIPASASAGDTIVVSAEATDRAGNVGTATHNVRVAGSGVVVGQVLDDTTGLPLGGASVKLVSGSAGIVETTTDEDGRYSLPVTSAQAVLVAQKDGANAVERKVAVDPTGGTIPVDARLTPLAVPAAGAIVSGPASVTIPSGATARLTRLSPQGLPGLLPLGFSPLVAFDLRSDAVALGPVDATVAVAVADPLHLVQYNTGLHEWVMVAASLTPGADGSVAIALPEAGAYALATADAGATAPTVPAAGQMLTGVPLAPIPPDATSATAVDPATLPPSGGKSKGTLALQSTTPLPSGTVVQAKVSETYTLGTGDIASLDPRLEDIVLYQRPVPVPPPSGTAAGTPTLYATLPITPSRSFDTTSLKEGKVHLDILAGRESVRGSTGGNQAVTVESGDIRLAGGAGALPEDTAIDVAAASLGSFLPSGGGLVALEQVSVDLSGKVLSRTAELSVAATGGVTANDTLLVAEVVHVDDIPRLVVVAMGQLVVDRIVSKPVPGLPGIVDGGDYVFYRSSPAAFVAGVTSSSAGPVKAVVTTDTLPFIGYARNDGSYIVAARPGALAVSARVPKTSLVGRGSVSVSTGETATLAIALSGQVTTATVSPADGSVAVPTSTQVQVDATAPLNPATAVAANISFTKTGSTTGVPVRLILAGSGRSLAIIPESALAPATAYAFTASGLADVYGGLVQVGAIHFTTKDDTPPTVNKEALVFSFPDANGMVSVTAPTGSLPPGSTVMIINSGNGVVVTLTADNDGALGLLVPATFPASISDELLVTITDPLGNVTTFTRSQFMDPATGQTAVGPGGGTVIASDGSGVELRIPEGALDKGIVFKISLVGTDALQQLFPDQKPDVPGGTVAGALKIETSNTPTFKKEVKLAFPLPDFSKGAVAPDNPENAFYYAYRRLQGPGDQYLFETLDEAFVEKDAASNPIKIVTASPPFGGYENTFGAFDINGVVSGQTLNYAFLMWTYNQLQPGKPLAGAVTGRVTRGVQTAAGVTYVGIPGVLVRGKDQAGNPLQSGAAITDPSGTYTLLDAQYTGGPVAVQASYGGKTLTGAGYEVNPHDGGVPTLLHLYKRVAVADVTFPPEPAQAPPPQIQIQVMKVVNGQRQDTAGLVAASTPLTIGFTTNLTIQSASVRNGSAASQGLTVRGPLTTDPSGFTYTAEDSAGLYTPTQPGTYTVSATGLPAFGPPITQSLTFRVTGAGGGVDNVPGVAPAVITARTSPKAGSTGAPVDALPEVAFTEPVKQLLGNVTLSELDANGNAIATVPVTLLGVDATGQPVTVSGPSTVVTALTIQPATGLKFSTNYRLALTNGIVDLDTPTPNALVPYATDFTTFGPTSLGDGTGNYASPGIVVLGSRAYLVQNSFARGDLKAYDIDDPVSPQEIVFDASTTSGQTMEQVTLSGVANRPVDIAGEKESPLTGGRVVVIATASTNLPKPSNLHVFDVSDDTHPHLIGAASVTSSAVEGTVGRVRVVNGLAYTLTSHKGLQVVDLQQAVTNLQQATADQAYSTGYWDMIRQLNTDGQGFGQDAIQVTIPVNKPTGTPYYMADLAVTSLLLDNVSQPLMLATGELGLAIGGAVQPGSLIYPTPQDPQTIDDPSGRLVSGQVIGAAHIGDRDIVAIAGSGFVKNPNGTQTAGLVLVAIDITDPRQPRTLRFILLDGGNPAPAATDLIFKGSLALVATANDVRLVNLADPTNLTLAGVLQGLGGILALSENNLIFSTAHSVFGGADPTDGVHVATLGPLPAILPVRPTLARRIEQPGQSVLEETLNDMTLSLRVFPKDYPAPQALLRLFAGGIPLSVNPISIVEGAAIYKIERGFRKLADKAITAVLSFFADGQEVRSAPAPIEIGSVQVTVDSNNDTVVNDKDDDDVRNDPNKDDAQRALRLGFWDAAGTANDENNLVDYATVRLRIKTNLAPDEQIGIMLPSGDWELHRKVQPSDLATLSPPPPADCLVQGKLHLCNSAAATLQTFINGSTGPLVPTPVGPGGLIQIPNIPDLVGKGDHEFLFRCRPRSDGNPACPSTTIQVVQVLESGIERLDEKRVEIRPIKNWMSLYNARPETGFRPKAGAELVPGWTSIPDQARKLTVLLHGFNVPANDARDTFFPTYFKRLYWTGEPVLQRQGNDASGFGHTVAFSWPGSQGTNLTTRPLFYPEDEFHALESGIPLSKLLKALKQVDGRVVNVIAHSLGNEVVNSALMQPGMDGVVDTYIMNEAALPAEAFDQGYVYSDIEKSEMWPHAMAHGFSGNPNDPCQGHDVAWVNEWTQMKAGQPPDLVPDDSQPPIPNTTPPIYPLKQVPNYSDLNAWNQRIAQNADLTPEPQYDIRWSQARATQCSDKDPGRGPWRGYFMGNRARTRIVNTFNPGDQALRIDKGFGQTGVISPFLPFPIPNPFTGDLYYVGIPTNLRVYAWHDSQLLQKPRLGSITNLVRPSEIADDRKTQEWARLNVKLADEESVWSDVTNHSSITRQWAELAFWFPALSGAAGDRAMGLKDVQGTSLRRIDDVDFGQYGGDDSGFDPSAFFEVRSHGYMVGKNFSDVWGGYVRLKEILGSPRP